MGLMLSNVGFVLLIMHCNLFSRELNFGKMKQAYFAGLNYCALAKKYV